uniref:U1-pseudomyrmecitoxin-Pt1 subunit SS2 n=1 Tax=Pseudomyrmex triplarinus TaxID=600763 RepID=TXSS2_PSETR|nr:RecName: Full=U1-pseudomyrmecitoxin-Pt1 subunit SS2; Short=U1-PSDTX-Pt1 subunit SS2; AltName: Full=Myrmexin III subunit SS2/Myrmexin V subunit SS2; AltName: Full=U1-pseudomyrmecitoxin-Pt1c subunit SS2/U1-pseudomyrmecitoxin-Pt1e subunit SS2; Short=U1-PSDTX-Pt1c subunit SS2/U1-PSDTX-Pt1e subunit SS2 [Pseudomyrmex triplarinus]
LFGGLLDKLREKIKKYCNKENLDKACSKL